MYHITATPMIETFVRNCHSPDTTWCDGLWRCISLCRTLLVTLADKCPVRRLYVPARLQWVWLLTWLLSVNLLFAVVSIHHRYLSRLIGMGLSRTLCLLSDCDLKSRPMKLFPSNTGMRLHYICIEFRFFRMIKFQHIFPYQWFWAADLIGMAGRFNK